MKGMLALGVLAAALATPAFAECPADAVQTAVNINLSAGDQKADLVAIAAQMAALVKLCPAQPHVLKVAAMLHGDLTEVAKTSDKVYEQALAAWTYFSAMRTARGPNEKPVMIMVGRQPRELDVYASDGLEAGLIGNLYVAEVKANKLTPDHEKMKAGEKVRACGYYDPIDVQNTAFFIQKNLKTPIPPAMNYIDRAAAACEKEMDKGVNDRILGLRASTWHKLVEADPARSDGDALMTVALRDVKRFHEINPTWDSAYLSSYDADQIEAFAKKRMINAAPLPAEEDWFKPGNPENPRVVAALAAKLDAAWAIDAPLGLAGAYKTYRDLIGALYTRTMTSGNVNPARHALALAAQGHSDGSLRSPATKDLKSPPDFLWNWIDASVKPTP
jgi:hypothetical protein